MFILFANCSDIDADTNHFNIFSHINEYFDADSLNHCLPTKQSVNLQSILHLNIRNLITNFDIFYANLKLLKHSFSVIVLTETATNAETENWLDIPGYTKLIKSRVGMKGGGLAIFFNNDLHISWKIRSDLSLKDCREMESLFVQISHSDLSLKDVIVGAMYHPPNTDYNLFHNNFSSVLTQINLERRPTYLLGDFNIDLLKYGTDSRAFEFLNNLLTNGFYPKIDKPTRLTDTTATLIDNIFVNVHCDSMISGPWLTDISDHLPIYATLPYPHSNLKRKTEYITKRLYTDEKLNAFKMDLATLNWSSVYENVPDKLNDVNTKFDNFMQRLDTLHNKHFPPVRLKIKNNGIFKPWISHAIKNSIKKKTNLYKKYIKEFLPGLKKILLDKYKIYKNKLTIIIRAAEKNYYQNKLNNVKENMSKTWKILNSMLFRNRKQKSVCEIELNGSIYSI